ncbi:RNA methyltransferase [Kineosporia sp. A_224]|uniref:TrmH family RNA methyltransferase n=1 Tax=Kineosporia sp. A_224 TaxID=1962180 RepID=UPI000B4C1327|nr:RNA methyltransferase [Kineosporia sp. A_224]
MRRLSGRSARVREGRFAVEGPQAVREAVAGPGVLALYATDDAADRHTAILDAARARGVEPVPVTDEVMAAMTETVTPQGLLAVCRLVDVPLADVVARAPRLVAVLAHVRDPGNAGTVIRAADAAGADAVVLTDASVDVHNPKCVRSTAGSLFHLPVVTGVPLADAVAALRAAGLTVYAADGAGDVDLDALLDAAEDARRSGAAGTGTGTDAGTDAAAPAGAGTEAAAPAGLAGPVAWVFGNEAWGLPEADRALADAVVRVPVHGQAESLNLGTAATVCLYAAARAHRPL